MFVVEERASTILYNFLVSQGDKRKYILPANICPIVPLTLFKAKQSFEFVDINLNTMCMDEAAVFELLQARLNDYAGVIYVHTYGVIRSAEEDFFLKLKNLSNSLLIIDDRCLCKPDFNVPYGTLADVVLYSTGESKVIDIGWGGYAWLRQGILYRQHNLAYSKEDYERLVSDYKACISDNRRYNYCESDWLKTRGDNSFYDYRQEVERQADVIFLHKQTMNEIYASNLSPAIQMSPEYQLWRFNILVDKKEQLLQNIFANGLFASSHYPSLTNIMSEGISLNAESLHKRVINLFNDLRFSLEQAEKIVEIINKHA